MLLSITYAFINSGINELILIDYDIVEFTNLTRQILFKDYEKYYNKDNFFQKILILCC